MILDSVLLADAQQCQFSLRGISKADRRRTHVLTQYPGVNVNCVLRLSLQFPEGSAMQIAHPPEDSLTWTLRGIDKLLAEHQQGGLTRGRLQSKEDMPCIQHRLGGSARYSETNQLIALAPSIKVATGLCHG